MTKLDACLNALDRLIADPTLTPRSKLLKLREVEAAARRMANAIARHPNEWRRPS